MSVVTSRWDVALVDGSITQGLGRQIRAVFADLGALVEVRRANGFFRPKLDGKARIEEGYPSWLICWSFFLEHNPHLLDYVNMARDDGFNDPWQPKEDPVVCTIAGQPKRSLSPLKSLDLKPWFIASDRGHALATLRTLVGKVRMALQSPILAEYFEALVAHDRTEKVAAFYFKHRALRFAAGDFSGGNHAGVTQKPPFQWRWPWTPAPAPESLELRVVRSALRRCRRLVRTSEPLLANEPCKRLFDYLVSAARRDEAQPSLAAALPNLTQQERDRALLDLGAALNELFSQSRFWGVPKAGLFGGAISPPPLHVMLYDDSMFDTEFGINVRDYVEMANRDYAKRESSLRKRKTRAMVVSAELKASLDQLRGDCKEFCVTGHDIEGKPRALKALEKQLFEPLPKRKIAEPEWVWKFNGPALHWRRFVHWLSRNFSAGLAWALQLGIVKPVVSLIIEHKIGASAIAGLAALGIISLQPSAPRLVPAAEVTQRIPQNADALQVATPLSGHSNIQSIAIASDGNHLLLLAGDTVHVVSGEGDLRCSLPRVETGYTSAAFRNPGTALTSDRDGNVALWSVADCSGVSRAVAPADQSMARSRDRRYASETYVEDVASDGELLASVGRDRLLHVFQVGAGQSIRQTFTNAAPPVLLRVALSGERVFYASESGPISSWLADGSSSTPSIVEAGGGRILLMETLTDGRLVTLRSDGNVRLHAASNGTYIGAVLAGTLTTAAIAPSNEWMVVGMADGRMVFLSLRTLRPLFTAPSTGRNRHVCISEPQTRPRCHLRAIAIGAERTGAGATAMYTSGADGQVLRWDVSLSDASIR